LIKRTTYHIIVEASHCLLINSLNHLERCLFYESRDIFISVFAATNYNYIAQLTELYSTTGAIKRVSLCFDYNSGTS